MSTFGTMVERIREDIDRGSDFDNRIKRSICDAIVYYSGRRLGFNIKRSRALIVSGMELVSLPTDWVEADYLRLEDDGHRVPIDEVSYTNIEERRESDQDRGEPEVYAIQHRELRLYPIPDHSYTLVFSFQFQLSNVSVSASDGATNGWMTEAEQPIRKWAQGDLLIQYIDGAEKIAKGKLLKGEADDAMDELEARAAREQSAGKIEGFL